MKQKDIATIIVIAFLSGIVSFFVSGKVFVTPKSRTQTAEVVDEISTNFQPVSYTHLTLPTSDLV